MKKAILDNSVKHINTNTENILKEAENLKKATEKICGYAELIKDKYLKTIINKIEGFKIKKRIKDINNIKLNG